MAAQLQFVVYRDGQGYWHWHLEDDDGQCHATGYRAYRNAEEAEAAVARVVGLPAETPVVRR